jgi:DNA-binding LytR/AlgR family response regulator
MKGPLWIELAKKAPDAFWRTHEKLLADLAKVAIEREGSRTEETAAR